ncbi:MAG: PLP-dependent aminotransferase family protein [Eubacterium sp.]|nr:PLP-dependent aminotransferase family protein [Eubacterium sp.]
MLSYSFSDNKTTPLYEQLYQMIRDDILSGRLHSFEPLPSKRSIANQLSISVITVENAYNQLMSEGYIESIPRKGFYVSDINQIELRPDNTVYGLKNTTFINTTSNNYSTDTSSPNYFADFTSNATDPESFPFTIWAKINRHILSEEQEKLMTNPPSNGMRELRIAIAQNLSSFRGINVNPNNIIIGAGTDTIYSILIQLLGFDIMYGTEDPGYDKISLALDANNVANVRIPIDDSGIIISELRKNMIDIIHTTPSHHFPTGITMPIKRRYELLNWAITPNRPLGLHNLKYIIEDDYDSEFRFTGLPIPSLFSIDNNERVIYMNTFTKSLASTIRISYMVLPDHLMNEYRERLSFYSCPVSTFEQLTLARFISEGFYEKHINRMRTSSRKKRDTLLKAIKSCKLGDISEIKEEQAGLHFILKLDASVSDESFILKCKKDGVNISSISEHSFMINYSSVPLDRIKDAVGVLETASSSSLA